MQVLWEGAEASILSTLAFAPMAILSMQNRIDEMARKAGFDAAGIAAVPAPGSAEDREERGRFIDWVDAGRAGEMEYLKRRDEAGALVRSSLRVALPWARSVIVCAANYNSAEPRSTDPAPHGTAWIARYAWTGSGDRPSDYHKVLLRKLENLRDRLAEEMSAFESRCFVDTGPVVERVYARYAGIGWVGKNTCILNQQLGSWLFLGEIYLAIALPPDDAETDHCGACRRSRLPSGSASSGSASRRRPWGPPWRPRSRRPRWRWRSLCRRPPPCPSPGRATPIPLSCGRRTGHWR